MVIDEWGYVGYCENISVSFGFYDMQTNMRLHIISATWANKRGVGIVFIAKNAAICVPMVMHITNMHCRGSDHQDAMRDCNISDVCRDTCHTTRRTHLGNNIWENNRSRQKTPSICGALQSTMPHLSFYLPAALHHKKRTS